MNHKTITTIIVLSLLLTGASCSKKTTSVTTNSWEIVNTIANTSIEPTESGCPQEGHIKSPASTNAASITFDNQTGGNMKVYWIDFEGARKFYRDLNAHTAYTQATWVGHVWVVADSGEKCVKLHSANAVEQTLVID